MTKPTVLFHTVMTMTFVITMLLYLLLAISTTKGIAALIASHNFYDQSDYGQQIWHAGHLLRTQGIVGLYQSDWLYPPPMCLVAWAMSFIPLVPGFWIWRIGTISLTAVLLRRAGLSWWVVMAGLGGPVEYFDLGLGQNGALTSGLLLTTILMIDSKPRWAGCLAGLLCIKPQIALLLPAILLQRRYRIVLLSSCITIATLSFFATILAGSQSWLLFMFVAQPHAHTILAYPFERPFQYAGFTVFFMGRSLGLSLCKAWIIQGLSSLLSVYFTIRVWNNAFFDQIDRMIITVCLWILAVPYGFDYDLICFSISVAALALRAPRWQWPILTGLWICSGIMPTITAETHIVLMPIAALICLALVQAQLKFHPGLQGQPQNANSSPVS